MIRSSQKTVPGPAGLPFIGNSHQFTGNYLTDNSQLLLDLFEEYGDPFQVKFGSQKMIFTIDPEIVQTILHTNAKNYVKGLSMRQQRPYLGNGLLLSEGSYWLRQRRLAQPTLPTHTHALGEKY